MLAGRALAKRAVLHQPFVRYSTRTEPKKRHPIRNFFVGSTLLLVTGFAGAVYYSLQNDEFYYKFTAYVPFGNMVVESVDDFFFRHTISRHAKEDAPLKHNKNIAVDASEKAAPTSPPQPKPVKPKEVQTVTKAVSTATSAKSHNQTEPKAAKASTKSAKSEAKSEAKQAKQTKPKQSNPESVVLVSDSAAAEPVNSKGAFKSALDPILSEVVGAVSACERAHADQFTNDAFYRGLVTSIERASEAIKRERADLTRQYAQRQKTAQSEFEKATDKEYLEAKHKLVESYNLRLQKAIDAVTEKAVATANNHLSSQYVELKRQFIGEVNNRVEQEREGRLSQIGELTQDVATLQEAMLSSGKILESEDGVVAFFVELANLQRLLAFGEPRPLRNQLNALTKALPSDPLVKAVVDSVPASVKRYGVLSHTQLAARFQLLEPEIRRSSLVPPDAGVAAHIGSFAGSLALVPKEGFPEGNDIESILARTNSYLREGNITNAVAEVNSLQGWPKKVAADWLAEGRRRSELEFLVNVLADEGRLWSISRTKK